MTGSNEFVQRFTIKKVEHGFMILFESEDNECYISAPDGDNLFDSYHQASIVLSQQLLYNLIREDDFVWR
jgi:hypothetical protein